MKLTFAPRDILQIDDATITYVNFEGEASQFNRAGDRNFSLIIPDEEIKNALVERGWNVKIRPPREEGETPFMTLKVKVKFSNYGPTVYLNSNGNMIKLDEDTISCLDDIDIENIDMDIRPYDWEVNGKTGRTAYLHSMCAVQRVDRFLEKYGPRD